MYKNIALKIKPSYAGYKCTWYFFDNVFFLFGINVYITEKNKVSKAGTKNSLFEKIAFIIVNFPPRLARRFWRNAIRCSPKTMIKRLAAIDNKKYKCVQTWKYSLDKPASVIFTVIYFVKTSLYSHKSFAGWP